MKQFMKKITVYVSVILFSTVLAVLLQKPIKAAGGYLFGDRLLIDNFIDIKATSAPALSNASQLRLYMDSTSNSMKVSQNASPFTTVTSGTTSGRNKLDNADFKIWQRGTSFVMSNSSYSADRWKSFIQNHGTEAFTFSQQTGSMPTVSSGTAAASPYVFKIICSTSIGSIGANATWALEQAIPREDWNNMVGQNITISFWARAHLAQAYYGYLFNPADHQYLFTYTISQADVWQKFSITILDDNSATQANLGSAGGCKVGFTIDCGSTFLDNTKVNIWNSGSAKYSGTIATNLSSNTANDLWFSQIQVEVGSTATDFESRPTQVEMTRCQRYFETNINYGTVPAAGISNSVCGVYLGGAYTTALVYSQWIPFVVKKRTTSPSISTYTTALAGTGGNWNVYQNSANTVNANPTVAQSGDMGFQVNVAGAFTLGSTYLMYGGWTASSDY